MEYLAKDENYDLIVDISVECYTQIWWFKGFSEARTEAKAWI